MSVAVPGLSKSTRASRIFRAAAIGVIALAMTLVFVQSAPAARAAGNELTNVFTHIGFEKDEAMSGSQLNVDFEFTLPELAAPGDTFGFVLPPELQPLSTSFKLKDELGAVIADVSLDPVTRQVTFTLTNWVNSNHSGYGKGKIFTKFSTSAGAGDNVTVDFVINPNEKFTGTVEVTEQYKIDRGSAAKGGWWAKPSDQGVVEGTNAIRWEAASAKGEFGTVKITDAMDPTGTAGDEDPIKANHQKMSCDTMEVYTRLVIDAFTGQLGPFDAAEEDAYTLDCSEAGFELVYTNLPKDRVVYLAFNTSITDATIGRYDNYVYVTHDGMEGAPANGHVIRTGGGEGEGGGQGYGEIKLVKYVEDIDGSGAAIGVTHDTLFDFKVLCTYRNVPITGFPKIYRVSVNEPVIQPRVPLGAMCSVVEEVDPLGDPKVELPDGFFLVSAEASKNVYTVKNTYPRVTPPVPSAELVIKKTVKDGRPAGSKPVIDASTKFKVEVTCKVGGDPVEGFPAEVEVTTAASAKVSAPVDAVCSAVETDKQGASSWYTSGPVTLAAAPAVNEITVTNVYKADPVVPPEPKVPLVTTGAETDALVWGSIASVVMGLGIMAAMRRRNRASAK